MRQSAADKIDRGIGRAEPKPRREVAPQKPPPSTFQARKGQRRKPGTGCVTQINDHLWEGRYSPIVNGQRMARNVYAKTEAECEKKLAELIREMKAEIAAGKEQVKQQNQQVEQTGLRGQSALGGPSYLCLWLVLWSKAKAKIQATKNSCKK